MPGAIDRADLLRWFRYLIWLIAASVLYVLLDFAIDLRPAGIHSSYRFTVGSLEFDRPVLLRQDNLMIVVIRRSGDTIKTLQMSNQILQDPTSRSSRQPEFARNLLRSRQPEYFVAMALGTHLGCPVEVNGKQLTETCSGARYDFAGRALVGSNEFRNLAVPEYSFSNQFKTLTVRP